MLGKPMHNSGLYHDNMIYLLVVAIVKVQEPCLEPCAIHIGLSGRVGLSVAGALGTYQNKRDDNQHV